MKSFHKELYLALAATAFGLMLAIAIADIYVSSKWWHQACTQFDAHLGWSAIPNCAAVVDGKKYSVNSHGYRSPEVNLGKKHVLIVGDSVAWGVGVNDDETISSSLQKKLSQDDRFGDLQVLNLGVSGYGIDQYFLRLEENIEKLNTQLIVMIIFGGNDVGDTLTNVSYGKTKPFFLPDTTKIKGSLRGAAISGDNLKLTNHPISRYSCANLLNRNKVLSLLFHKWEDSLCKNNSLAMSGDASAYVISSLIVKTRELADHHKVGLLFVLSPSEGDFKYGSAQEMRDYIQRQLKGGKGLETDISNKFGLVYFQDIFDQMNIKYLDFYNIIQKNYQAPDRMFVDKLHLSPLGGDFLAGEIFNWMLSFHSQ